MMNVAKNERYISELLAQAADALQQQTGLQLTVIDQPQAVRRASHVDAIVAIEPDGPRYHAEVKKWAQHVSLGALTNQIQCLPQPALLVAGYINPNMAEHLRGQGINFLDTAGNAF